MGSVGLSGDWLGTSQAAAEQLLMELEREQPDAVRQWGRSFGSRLSLLGAGGGLEGGLGVEQTLGQQAAAASRVSSKESGVAATPQGMLQEVIQSQLQPFFQQLFQQQQLLERMMEQLQQVQWPIVQAADKKQLQQDTAQHQHQQLRACQADQQQGEAQQEPSVLLAEDHAVHAASGPPHGSQELLQELTGDPHSTVLTQVSPRRELFRGDIIEKGGSAEVLQEEESATVPVGSPTIEHSNGLAGCRVWDGVLQHDAADDGLSSRNISDDSEAGCQPPAGAGAAAGDGEDCGVGTFDVRRDAAAAAALTGQPQDQMMCYEGVRWSVDSWGEVKQPEEGEGGRAVRKDVWQPLQQQQMEVWGSPRSQMRHYMQPAVQHYEEEKQQQQRQPQLQQQQQVIQGQLQQQEQHLQEPESQQQEQQLQQQEQQLQPHQLLQEADGVERWDGGEGLMAVGSCQEEAVLEPAVPQAEVLHDQQRPELVQQCQQGLSKQLQPELLPAGSDMGPQHVLGGAAAGTVEEACAAGGGGSRSSTYLCEEQPFHGQGDCKAVAMEEGGCAWRVTNPASEGQVWAALEKPAVCERWLGTSSDYSPSMIISYSSKLAYFHPP
jgi:hypothetical protein